MDNEIINIIRNMTLKEKIGQLILGQAEGYNMTDEFKEYVKDYPLFGYRISGVNIKDNDQVKVFTNSIKKTYAELGNHIEPILACDQEGGVLSVFGSLVTEFPGNMALGAAHEAELSYLQGDITGWELSELGIDMAFAPCVDVNLQVNNPVIGVRSFGSNQEKVAQLGLQFVKGLNSGGILACGKHFPGHGNTDVDTHKSLAVNYADIEILEKTELLPFRVLAENNMDSVMVSHVLYPSIEEKNIPASLSESIINGILRKRLNYGGVIMTDDMEMRAMIDNYGIKEAVYMFIKAGGDVALINGTREIVIQAYDGLIDSVRDGKLSEKRIDESLYRILNVKKNLKYYKEHRVLISRDKEELAAQICSKSITLVRDENKIIPLREGLKVLVIKPRQIQMSAADTTEGKKINITRYMKEYCSFVNEIEINIEEECSIGELYKLSLNYDVIIQCTINCVRYPQQTKICEEICKARPTIVIMLRDPYDVKYLPYGAAVIAAYSALDNSMKSAVEAVFGKRHFCGELPVHIGF